jgi:hypothetical protein
MILRLFQNISDTNVVQKDIIQKAEISGTLLEDCSILEPVIATPLIAASDLKYINYAEIPDFGRYYYVTDIICRGKLFEVHMKIDVLNTYKDQIKPLQAVIARQEQNNNVMLTDGLLKTYADPHIEIRRASGGFTDFQYIFCVAG